MKTGAAEVHFMLEPQRGIALWLGLLFLLARSPLRGQNLGADEKTKPAQVRVLYGSAVAYPGSPVELSLYLSAPEIVGSLESELRFSKDLLEFVNVRQSNVLDSIGQVSLETKVEDDPQEKFRSVLKLSVRNSQNDRKPIPAGLLAFVTFKVSGNAQPGDLKLDHRATARDIRPEGKPIPDVAVESPVLSIYPKGINPLLTCFFFTH